MTSQHAPEEVVITGRTIVHEYAYAFTYPDMHPRWVWPRPVQSHVTTGSFSLFTHRGRWGIGTRDMGMMHTPDAPLRVQWFPDKDTAVAAWLLGCKP